MKSKFNFSVNKYSNLLVEDLIKHKEKLNLEVSHGPLNSTIIDAGINIGVSFEKNIPPGIDTKEDLITLKSIIKTKNEKN